MSTKPTTWAHWADTHYKAIAAAVSPEILAKYSTKPDAPAAPLQFRKRGERGPELYPELTAATADYELAIRTRSLEWGTLKAIALKHNVAPASIRYRFKRNLEMLEKQACK